jgi:hypothetical protein
MGSRTDPGSPVVDEAYTREAGNAHILATADAEVAGLLHEILKQLKIMNMHLSLITDAEIEKIEV